MPRRLTVKDFTIQQVPYSVAWRAINKRTKETVFIDRNKYKVIWMLRLYVAGL